MFLFTAINFASNRNNPSIIKRGKVLTPKISTSCIQLWHFLTSEYNFHGALEGTERFYLRLLLKVGTKA